MLPKQDAFQSYHLYKSIRIFSIQTQAINYSCRVLGEKRLLTESALEIQDLTRAISFTVSDCILDHIRGNSKILPEKNCKSKFKFENKLFTFQF